MCACGWNLQYLCVCAGEGGEREEAYFPQQAVINTNRAVVSNCPLVMWFLMKLDSNKLGFGTDLKDP